MKSPFPNPETENAWILLAQQGHTDYAGRIVQAHRKFVEWHAYNFGAKNGVDFKDLISAGNQGLLFAIGRFDTNRGVKLLSFAVWYICLYIRNEGQRIRYPFHIPDNRLAAHTKAQKAYSRGEITLDELHEKALPVTESLEKMADPESGLRLMDLLQGEDLRDEMDNPAKGIWERSAEFLTNAEYQLLWYRLGDNMTLDQIGEIYGLSKERVRQKLAPIISKLRRHAKALV